MKEVEVESKSLDDAERILLESKEAKINVIIIGGYAVRAYTPQTMRYTKDIDLVVKKEEDLQKLKYVLKRIGYRVRDRPHGLTGFRRIEGTPIVLNASVDKIKGTIREVKSFYGNRVVRLRVSIIEDLFILKANAGRERDIIDISLLLLDSIDTLNAEKLRTKLGAQKKEFISFTKNLADMIGTKKFRTAWKDFLGRPIKKEEERRLWEKLSSLTRHLE